MKILQVSDSLNGVYIGVRNTWYIPEYYDLKGNPIKIKYPVCDSLYRDVIIDPNTRLYGFVDGNNNVIVPCIYYQANSYEDGLAVVVKEGISGYRCGIIDMYGKEVLPLTYANVEILPGGGIVIVNAEGKIGFGDRDGKVRIPYKYSDIDTAPNSGDGSFCTIYDGDKEGILSIHGQKLIPCQYEKITRGRDSLRDYYILKKDGKYGLAEANAGKIIAPCKYHIIYAIKGIENICEISSKKGDSYGHGLLELSTGREIIPCTYEKIELLPNNTFLVKNNSGYGIIDLQGNTIVPFQYSSAKLYKNSYLIVVQRSTGA